MSQNALTVEGLGKRYRIAHQRERYGRLTESLVGVARAPFDRMRAKPRSTSEWFWALRDVSLEVGHGDVVGVIGRNGAGKSTLLKTLSRITEPTAGSAKLTGRVGSLLEIGTGFHPELTGRENIFLSAAVLGMRRNETGRRFAEIVDFAGVEQFLDTPVKRYSSGMQVRLGFAVAAHLETEILIVDEVLAVGDADFQRKCLAKMEDVSSRGRTVLFVSHNMVAVEALCSTAVLLEHGRVVAAGSTKETVAEYLRSASHSASVKVNDRPDRQGDGRLRITSVESTVRTGNPSSIRLGYVSDPGCHDISISVGLFSLTGEGAAYLANDLSGDPIGEVPTTGWLTCSIDNATILPGRYRMNIYCTVNGLVSDWVKDAAYVDVHEGDLYGTGRLPPSGYGTVGVRHHWSVSP